MGFVGGGGESALPPGSCGGLGGVCAALLLVLGVCWIEGVYCSRQSAALEVLLHPDASVL